MAQKDNKITLTKGEEEVMQLLWELGKGTVNDILERYGQEKPKYTTVATFLKLLEDKGYVGHKAAKAMKRSKSIEARQEKAISEKSKLAFHVPTTDLLSLPAQAQSDISIAKTNTNTKLRFFIILFLH